MAGRARKAATKTEPKTVELQILEEASKVADKYSSAASTMEKAESAMESFSEFAKNTKEAIINEVKSASIEAEAKKAQLKNEMELAQKAHDENVAKLEEEYESKKATLETEYSDESEKYAEELKELKRTHDQEIYDLNLEHRNQMDQIRAQFKANLNQWWKDTMEAEAESKGMKVVESKEYHTILNERNSLKKEKDAAFEKAREKGLNEAKNEYLDQKLAEEQTAKEEQISYKETNTRLTYEIEGLNKEIAWLKEQLSKKDIQISEQVRASQEIATSYANSNRGVSQQR